MDVYLISRAGRFVASTTDQTTSADGTYQLRTQDIAATIYSELFKDFYSKRNKQRLILEKDPNTTKPTTTPLRRSRLESGS